jgi:hypothetical protein
MLHARELLLVRNKHYTVQQEGKKQLAAIIRVTSYCIQIAISLVFSSERT